MKFNLHLPELLELATHTSFIADCQNRGENYGRTHNLVAR
jgi:hypothetical protein